MEETDTQRLIGMENMTESTAGVGGNDSVIERETGPESAGALGTVVCVMPGPQKLGGRGCKFADGNACRSVHIALKSSS